MRITNITTTAVLGVLISAAVMFGSLHLPQVAGDHKVTHDDVGVAKLSVDLHHHTDKAGHQMGDQFSADGRSLKLLRKHKARHADTFSGRAA